ncbi:MAG: oligopeptide transporter, OPT family [Clostridiales bacterium]|nr:oligopeptide transporter, OPT family [Clostridiales bacterium]
MFEPYIKDEEKKPEFTVTSIVSGILLAVLFGASNAYLGLKVGMTVSASIPAAVLGMGIIRVLCKRKSILESNMIQTIGSAGESLAAGVIFTVPAIFIWAKEGRTHTPGILEIAGIALAGGILGILFMIPLRKALIVREHERLPFPEGTACSKVLMAGEENKNESSFVFLPMGIAAAAKWITDGLKLASGEVNVVLRSLGTEFGVSVYPALSGVGYICGVRISAIMFAGGVFAWLVLIPLIGIFGGNTILYPADIPVYEIWNTKGAAGIWNDYIRYIGAGAVAAGGMISLIKSLPMLVGIFRDSMKALTGKKTEGMKEGRTSQELSMKVIVGIIVLVAAFLIVTPQIPVGITGTILILIFGFFFAVVAARMAGLVGSSNNPISGMTIATLLLSAGILKLSGNTGIGGMLSAMAIGSVIAIIAAIAGDTSQDLKTGYLLGATPKRQQIGELIGVIVSALTIGGVLYLLNAAWGFGSKELAAPQATLMKMIVEGVMGGKLPWSLIWIGVFIAITAQLLAVPILPFAIGLYLPVQTSACIMIGGLLRAYTEKRGLSVSRGILCSSGLIAGEGLMGVLLAVFELIPFQQGTLAEWFAIGTRFHTGWIGGILVLLGLTGTILVCVRKGDA